MWDDYATIVEDTYYLTQKTIDTVIELEYTNKVRRYLAAHPNTFGCDCGIN